MCKWKNITNFYIIKQKYRGAPAILCLIILEFVYFVMLAISSHKL